MGFTRSDLILKAKTELGEIAGSVPTTDAAGQPYFYAVNDALSNMSLFNTGGDSDLANLDANTLRILSSGVQYYILRVIVKTFLSIPRMDADNVSRDNFNRAVNLMKMARDEFNAGISGADTPPEVIRPSESVVTWMSGEDGGDVTGRNTYTEGNNYQKHPDDFFVDDLGRDLTGYQDDEG